MSLSVALSNSVPKEEIRALLATEMQRRLETRQTRWTALEGPQKKFVNSEHPHTVWRSARRFKKCWNASSISQACREIREGGARSSVPQNVSRNGGTRQAGSVCLRTRRLGMESWGAKMGRAQRSRTTT